MSSCLREQKNTLSEEMKLDCQAVLNANMKLVGPNVGVSSPVYLAVFEKVDF